MAAVTEASNARIESRKGNRCTWTLARIGCLLQIRCTTGWWRRSHIRQWATSPRDCSRRRFNVIAQAEKLLHLTAAAMHVLQIAKFTLLTAGFGQRDRLRRRRRSHVALRSGQFQPERHRLRRSPLSHSGSSPAAIRTSTTSASRSGKRAATLEATIKAMDLTFGNGATATFGPERATAARVGPGQVVPVTDLSVTGSVSCARHGRADSDTAHR